MKPTVFTDLKLSVSTEVASESEQDGLLEGGYTFDSLTTSRFILIRIDNEGKSHVVDVHDWEADLENLKYFCADE
ncbi:hypothetical protein BAOM_3125 [Peribacillus asahii]|uniref:Uncharacterized protein n=1 Tax=Peribacillus asahii TaxID=228899 RepID=A0A3Q9RPF1_9BACI|nr:hypothetical protein [Peribacillus asahii]AZV43734.1 hypothetical protein BAOM_3125 [Peribacillus asahii]